MINLIKRQKAGELTIINLFNVDYQAKEDDIRQLYKDVNIQTITELKAGLFLVELEPEEAIKLVEIGATTLKGREFFMKLGYANKQQHPDEQWHQVNSEKYKGEVGHRADRPKRGGKKPDYNRREQFDQGEEPSPGFKKSYNKDFNMSRNREEGPIDTDNKFFKGHDLGAGSFNIRFTNSSTSKKDDDVAPETNKPKVAKPNPFGDAKPVEDKPSADLKEQEKREEKEQVKDMQEHFEEKKDQIKKDIVKSNLYLSTPVNSPNPEYIEELNKQEGKDEKSKNPPGISAFGGQKGSKPVFRNSEQEKNKAKAGGDKGQKGGGTDQSKRFNKFDMLQ